MFLFIRQRNRYTLKQSPTVYIFQLLLHSTLNIYIYIHSLCNSCDKCRKSISLLEVVVVMGLRRWEEGEVVA